MASMKDTIDPKALAGIAVELDRLVESGLIELGKFYTIETIAPIFHARLVAVSPTTLVCEECTWLGDLGQRAEYESGRNPVEANFYGERKLIMTTSVISLGVAPIQKPLSKRSK